MKYANKPIPVKLDADLNARIEEMSRRMGEHKSTVMRIAMRVGLDQLEKAWQGDPKSSSLSYPPYRDEFAVTEDKPKKKKSA